MCADVRKAIKDPAVHTQLTEGLCAQAEGCNLIMGNSIQDYAQQLAALRQEAQNLRIRALGIIVCMNDETLIG